MGDWSSPLVRLDACLLAGALLQLILVLKARRFRAHDWIMPLFLLTGVSIGWFVFILICSNVLAAADAFIIGFFFALTGSGLFVADAAPTRLRAATLLSLTLTFWAMYSAGGWSRAWLWAAIPMTGAAVWFSWYPQMTPLPGRMALQAWSLMAAAALAADGVPARAAAVLKSAMLEQSAHTLLPGEVLITGAQLFLFAQLAAGVVLLSDETTWRGWYPSAKDEPVRWRVVLALLGQGAVLAWARTAGGELRGQLVSLAVLGALAHGAMGGDADADEPLPVVDPGLDPRLSRDDEIFLARVRGSVLAFFKRLSPS